MTLQVQGNLWVQWCFYLQHRIIASGQQTLLLQDMTAATRSFIALTFRIPTGSKMINELRMSCSGRYKILTSQSDCVFVDHFCKIPGNLCCCWYLLETDASHSDCMFVDHFCVCKIPGHVWVVDVFRNKNITIDGVSVDHFHKIPGNISLVDNLETKLSLHFPP